MAGTPDADPSRPDHRDGSRSGPWAGLRAWLAARPDRPWVAAAWGATVAMLAAGWWLKAQCNDWSVWQRGGQYARGCYNDAMPLYGARQLHTHWPYGEALNEYPPVIAFWQALTGRLVDSAAAFWTLNAALLSVVALLGTWCLLQAAPDRRRVLWYAAAPGLALYAFHNWDLLAVVPVAAGLWMWRADRPGWAGAWFALGTAAKLYPAALLVVFGLALLRRERGLGRRGWRFGLSAGGVLALTIGTVAVWAPQGLVDTWEFHAGRSATFESHWHGLNVLSGEVGWDLRPGEEAARLGLPVLGLAVAGMGWLVLSGRMDPVRAGLACILAWQLVSPVLSIQYALWILPFVVVLPVPWRRVAAWMATDAWVYVAVMAAFHGFDTGADRQVQLAWASVARAVALAVLLSWCFRRPAKDAGEAKLPSAPDPQHSTKVDGPHQTLKPAPP